MLLDLVHSHSAANEREGICNFDGSGSLYCRGHHPAWGSRLFAYGRHDVIHYLLSNVKYLDGRVSTSTASASTA